MDSSSNGRPFIGPSRSQKQNESHLTGGATEPQLVQLLLGGVGQRHSRAAGDVTAVVHGHHVEQVDELGRRGDGHDLRRRRPVLGLLAPAQHHQVQQVDRMSRILRPIQSPSHIRQAIQIRGVFEVHHLLTRAVLFFSSRGQ